MATKLLKMATQRLPTGRGRSNERNSIEVNVNLIDLDADADVSDIEDLEALPPPYTSTTTTNCRHHQHEGLLSRRCPAACCHVKPFSSRSLIRLLKFVVIFISGFFAALFLIPLAEWPRHDPFDDAFIHFEQPMDHISPFEPGYPVEFLKSVLPVSCHSHNDYWRRRPLFSALGSGCISVEADVWLVHDDLYVGHSLNELTDDRTLSAMYIWPLLEVMEFMNQDHFGSNAVAKPRGVFYQDPEQTLVLLIDFKTGDEWEYVMEQIAPLRERGYLTHWNGKDRIMGPITIVASGEAPFAQITANETYRDIFYDAPLDSLNNMYNPSNSYYASASLKTAIGVLSGFMFSSSQTELLEGQIHSARDHGLIPRYWGTPRWPRGLRDEVWGVLLHKNIGVLNVDDLRAARKGQWGIWK